MDIRDFVSQESWKMDAYQLLAECYGLPGQGLGATLEQLQQRLKTLCPLAAAYVLPMIEEVNQRENPERLEIEYARLFLGPYGLLAPPYGSVYLEGGRKVMGDSTVHALQMYAAAGLGVAETFNDAPDHIAAELEFVYFLLFKAVEAMGKGETESAVRYMDMRRAFLQTHLGAWMSDFAGKVEESTENGFYKNLAKATKIFIQMDLEEISGIPASSEGHGSPSGDAREQGYLQG